MSPPLLVVGGLLVAWSALASLASGTTGATKPPSATVTVTLGQPSEYTIGLSKRRVPVGTVVFEVADRGALPHNFKVCVRASGSTKPNDCAGKATSTLRPGDSAVLEVVFEQAGSFEYLSTLPAPANLGMRGLLDVGRKGQETTTAGSPPTKLALARKVTTCMYSNGFPNYPDSGDRHGSKPSAGQAEAAETSCEQLARRALGLP